MKKGETKEPCVVSTVAELLSDTWTMRIIHTLLSTKRMRFCELERSLPGISTRTLTIKLKTLVEKDILSKTDEGYSMSMIGKKLRPVIKAMEQFGKQL
jgi:DNA-binding HxlR family transcriptional regulator